MVSCRARIAALGVIPLALAGCGKSDWGYLNGTVLVNGQPAGPGTITLESTDRERPGAIAAFGEDGKYEVISSGRKEGAATGEYRVSIRGGEDLGVEHAGPAPVSKIPAKYNSSQTSGLTVTIEPGEKTQDFDLKP